MVVSVTGASGTIDWLGKTWNLPADSGLPQEVCPTQYYNEQWSGSTYFQGGNGWNLTASLGQAALRIKRVYGNFPSVVYQLNQINVRDINNGGINTYDRNFFATYPGPVTTHYTQNAFGLVNSVPPALPTFSEYQITDEFFGSYTIGGITYSWSKGTNWPA